MGIFSSVLRKERTQIHVPHQKELETLFTKLCEYGVFNRALFEKHFVGPSPDLGCTLFEHLFIDFVVSSPKNQSLFVERCCAIVNSTFANERERIIFYIGLLAKKKDQFSAGEVTELMMTLCKYRVQLQAYCGGSGLEGQLSDSDETFTSIVSSVMKSRPVISAGDIAEWAIENAPSIFESFQVWLNFKFTGVNQNVAFEIRCQPTGSSSLLSTTLMWFLSCALPSCFTSVDESHAKTGDDVQPTSRMHIWHLLYDSHRDGLSLNRFKVKVMEYKSPTVSLVYFVNGVKLALCLDGPWVDSPEKFGGPFCHLIEVFPKVCVLEATNRMFYFKELGRAVPTGIHVGSQNVPLLKIQSDFESAELTYRGMTATKVSRLEVWGCGGESAMQKQLDVKKWEQNEIEKRKKVKLPEWESDKTILDLGGVCVDHSQRGDV